MVQLDATGGLWKYYYTSMTFYSSNLSNIEMFINGNEDGKVTDPSSGTIYLAEVAATNIENENTVSYTLETSVEGSGSLTGTASGTYSKDTEVTLTAVPNDGFKFIGWIKNNEIIKGNETYKFAIDADTSIKAVFGNQYLNYPYLAAYATEGGKVLNGEPQFYPAGAGVSVTAVADDGYTFKGWSYSEDGDIAFTGNNYISKLSSDTVLYAIFEKTPAKQFHFTPLATEGGTVSGTEAGIYPEGTQITLTATPNEGYSFAGWKHQYGNINVDSTTYTFELKDNLAVTAMFVKNEGTTYSFNVTCGSKGTVNGTQSGTYAEGTEITVKAAPNTDKFFTGWKVKGSDHYFSIDDTYTFTLNSDVEIEAVFDSIPMPMHHLVVYCDEGGKLKEDVDGYYTPGQSAYLTAVADEGYRFIGWSYGEADAKISITDTSYRVTPTGEAKYYAHFEKIPENTYHLTISSGGYGTLTGAQSGDYEKGTQVTASAEPNGKYVFKYWRDKYNNEVSSENPYTFTMDSDKELYAYFVEDTRPYYSIEIVEGENGTFSGADSKEYPEGKEITVTANPNSGYSFVGWEIYGTGILASRDQTYTFKVEEDTKLQPVFDKYNLTQYFYLGLYSADKGGSVSKVKGWHVAGDSFTITATPEKGFKFTGWSHTENGSIVFTEKSIPVRMSGNVDYYAHFEEDIGTNTLISGKNNQSGSMNADNGSSITFTSNSMDYPFRYRGALKVDYNINVDNTYGGYAGRPITLDNTYSAKYGVEGIEFWYLTPKDYSGKIALCLQSSSTGLDDLVQLVSTDGEWRHFIYKTNKANVYDMTLYINGNKNGYTTSKNGTQGYTGTLYLANISTVNNITESLKASILSKHEGILTQEQIDDLSTVINKWSEPQLMLYDKMADNFSKNNYHGEDMGASGLYSDTYNTLIMNVDNLYSEKVMGRQSKANWHVKFHEEAHQLDDAVKGYLSVSRYQNFAEPIVTDLTNAINKAIDWKYGSNSDVQHLSTLEDLENISEEASTAISEWINTFYPDDYYNERRTLSIELFTDSLGFATQGKASCDGYYGHGATDWRRLGINGACLEGWAEFCSIAFYPDDAIEITKELMPETVKAMNNELVACQEHANSHCLTFTRYIYYKG